MNINNNIRNKEIKHRSTFAILFYINRTKVRKDGTCQLLCKVSVDANWEQIGISVCNPVAPLFSAAEPSTGIGQKNIAERYALLSDRQMIVSFTRDTYAVKLPILEN